MASLQTKALTTLLLPLSLYFHVVRQVRQRCPNLLQMGKTARTSPMSSPTGRGPHSPMHNNCAI
jgi:hypothetical protein